MDDLTEGRLARYRSKVRAIGFALIALAAVTVMVLAAPEAPKTVDSTRFDRLLTQAHSDYEESAARTSGAPQQQVVNGWIAKDLLTIHAEQLTAMLNASQTTASDERLPWLMLLLVLALCLHAATLPRPLSGPHPLFASSASPWGSAPPRAESAGAAGRGQPAPPNTPDGEGASEEEER